MWIVFFRAQGLFSLSQLTNSIEYGIELLVNRMLTLMNKTTEKCDRVLKDYET